jgi:surfactin synthase thioesterase subunit
MARLRILRARPTDGLAPYLDRPYALFGHCMGALLAHQLAVRLRELPSVRRVG